MVILLCYRPAFDDFSFRFVDENCRIFVVVVFVAKINLFSSTKIFVFVVLWRAQYNSTVQWCWTQLESIIIYQQRPLHTATCHLTTTTASYLANSSHVNTRHMSHTST